MNFKRPVLFVLFFLISSFFILFFHISNVRAEEISAPTIIGAGYLRDIDGLGEFGIKGLTPANTEVLVFIDGVYSDLAKVAREGTASDSFYYRLQENLEKGGHKAEVISRDMESGVLSEPAVIDFKIYEALPAPTLVGPGKNDIIGAPKPFITGLTVSNSKVYIYIDGIYNGNIENLRHQSGTADFFYRPFLNLNPGAHRAWAIAEDSQGGQSQISNVLEFKVEPPLPAPVIVGHQTSGQTLLIQALAKNNLKIRVFIDHNLHEEFETIPHESGTANFSYSREGLTRGGHLAYTTAMDSRGKESPWSNIIYFDIKAPDIAQGAEETSQQTLAEILEEADKKIEEDKKIETITDIQMREEEPALDEGRQARPIPEKGPEKQISQRKKLNLAVFIAFLAGIVVWIYWVNKELRKEKPEEKNKSTNNSNKVEF